MYYKRRRKASVDYGAIPRGSSSARSAKAAGIHNHLRDDVGIHVRRRATVLKVAVLLRLSITRNAHRAAAVRHPVGELVDRGRLVRTGQATLVTLSVRLNVGLVIRAELVHRRNDLPISLVRSLAGHARIAHVLGGEVRVAAGTVPVPGPRLRVEGHGDLEVLAHPLHDVARHPHVITAVDALHGPTWYSHCPGMTSEFVPAMVSPARKHIS